MYGLWGGLATPPAFHDEAAYVLQARIFASGRWTAPGRPLPEFFEQYHVVVTPRLYSKYPPGHSLLLAPATRLGLPGLVPILLLSGAAVLVFTLARTLAGARAAVLTWILWLTSPGVLRFFPSYLSQATTTAATLLAWWALLRWHRAPRRGAWLLVAGGSLAWAAITRPLTALTLGTPLIAYSLIVAARSRAWRPLLVAAAVGLAVVAILPLWSAKSTGSWRETPYTQYARLYYPSDLLGFGFDSTPPLRALNTDMERLADRVRRVHERHTADALPRTAAVRLRFIGGEMWGGWRVALLPFAAVGVARMARPVLIAAAGVLLLFLGHLGFAHLDDWTVYYLEALPLLAFLTASGICRMLELFGARAKGRAPPMLHPFWTQVVVVATCVAVAGIVLDVTVAGIRNRRLHSYHRAFHALLEGLGGRRSIVFVRYRPDHDVDYSLVVNEPDLAAAPVWVAHDLGPRNWALLALDPTRCGYLFEEAGFRLRPLTQEGAPRLGQENAGDWTAPRTAPCPAPGLAPPTRPERDGGG